MSLAERLLRAIHTQPGSTDRDLTDTLLGPDQGQQAVNQVARRLAFEGKLERLNRPDGKIGNYPVHSIPPESSQPMPPATTEGLSEDEIKTALVSWLTERGWRVDTLALGKTHGADIRAQRGTIAWVIEVKGIGSRNAMRVNYFLAVLGETLQRMDDPAARYSIALPDIPQFRRIWARLPDIAKQRTGITALFVASSGEVKEA